MSSTPRNCGLIRGWCAISPHSWERRQPRCHRARRRSIEKSRWPAKIRARDADSGNPGTEREYPCTMHL
jgi:hypothetical protein